MLFEDVVVVKLCECLWGLLIGCSKEVSVGCYVLGDCLGVGGMGMVYCVCDW